MPPLTAQLLQATIRSQLLADCLALVDEEIASKKGASGWALRTTHSLLKSMSLRLVREALDDLLDDFIAQLEPFYETRGETPIVEHFQNCRTEVASALCAVADEHLFKGQHPALRKTYEALRPLARRNVEEAVPRIGDLIARYTGE